MNIQRVVVTNGLNYCPNDSLGGQTPGFSHLSYTNRQNKGNFPVTSLLPRGLTPWGLLGAWAGRAVFPRVRAS